MMKVELNTNFRRFAPIIANSFVILLRRKLRFQLRWRSLESTYEVRQEMRKHLPRRPLYGLVSLFYTFIIKAFLNLYSRTRALCARNCKRDYGQSPP